MVKSINFIGIDPIVLYIPFEKLDIILVVKEYNR